MFNHAYWAAQYFPPVWFAPGDESAVLPSELHGGWAPPWQFIGPPPARQPDRKPPPKPRFNEDEDCGLLIALGVL